MFDLDAQMSLTQAISLNDDGSLLDGFNFFVNSAVREKKTTYDALVEYIRDGEIKSAIDYNFIYQISDNYHFVPSHERFYWLELKSFKRQKIQEFMRDLLEKIISSENVIGYDYALFDCPPSFTYLSYSILSCCDLILIPINPDYYGVKGVSIIFKVLKEAVAPLPIPKIAVFMNKAKALNGDLTKESARYWNEVQKICDKQSKETGIAIRCFNSPIYDRVAIKRAIIGGSGLPDSFVSDFKSLWNNIKEFINE
jgi:chromosome partitioning protein